MNPWKRAWCACLAAVMLLLAAGCVSTGRKQDKEGADETEKGVKPGTTIPFVPAMSTAALTVGPGAAYPDLLSPACTAEWLPQGNPAAMTGAFITIRCRIESAFGDASIAYDVANLRGVRAWLTTPDGKKITASRQMLDPVLEETKQGALRMYARQAVLVFPLPPSALQIPVPAAGEPTPSVCLVLEGHNSTYHFAWLPTLPEKVAEVPYLQKKETKAKIKKTVDGAKTKTKSFLHTFD